MEKNVPVNLEMSFVQAANVVARELDGEAVLLDLETSSYFGLDGIGFHIWTALDGKTRLAAIVTQLEEEYEVSRDRLKEDVCALVQSMIDKGLVGIANRPQVR